MVGYSAKSLDWRCYLVLRDIMDSLAGCPVADITIIELAAFVHMDDPAALPLLLMT